MYRHFLLLRDAIIFSMSAIYEDVDYLGPFIASLSKGF